MQRAVTFHGDGFLFLELPHVAPLTGHVYSGFGFRSTRDSGLLYRRGSEVRQRPLPAAAAWGSGGWRAGGVPRPGALTWPLSPG